MEIGSAWSDHVTGSPPPCKAVDLSVVLRDKSIVADVAATLKQIAGRRGLSDNIPNEMAVVARDLQSRSFEGGAACNAVISGDAHGRLISHKGSQWYSQKPLRRRQS